VSITIEITSGLYIAAQALVFFVRLPLVGPRHFSPSHPAIDDRGAVGKLTSDSPREYARPGVDKLALTIPIPIKENRAGILGEQIADGIGIAKQERRTVAVVAAFDWVRVLSHDGSLSAENGFRFAP
jgi:hypothetical protein